MKLLACKSCSTTPYPFSAAKDSGVRPELSLASTLAPFSSSTLLVCMNYCIELSTKLLTNELTTALNRECRAQGRRGSPRSCVLLLPMSGVAASRPRRDSCHSWRLVRVRNIILMPRDPVQRALRGAALAMHSFGRAELVSRRYHCREST
jgi:hypothetical protein